MASGKSGLGISVLFGTPVVLGASSSTEVVSSDSIMSYYHRIAALGGYDSARLTITVPNMATAEMWLDNALGWHIEVFGRHTSKIWEGFVNQIIVNGNKFSASIGPLMDVTNRVSIMYTPVISEESGYYIVGTQTETLISDDEESQRKYGILERVLSGGQMLDDASGNSDADYVRDVYLSENAYPRTSSSLSFGEGEGMGGITLEISCLGYSYWLDKYIYNGGSDLIVTISEKLEDVLTADPNGIVSADYSYIEDNNNITLELEETNRTALTIIKELLTFGNGTDTPYTFGIYNNRTVKYNVVGNDVSYHYKIFSHADTFSSANGAIIEPYDVLPGKWARIDDFQMDASRMGLSVFEDPKAIFIESVDYTAPRTININGSPIIRLPQLLAQLGYGGLN